MNATTAMRDPIRAEPLVLPEQFAATGMQTQGIIAVLAVVCLPVGMLWDISWHISIGRDTFWAPAHIVMQLGGFIPALLFGYEALRLTFRGSPAEQAATIRFWGFRGAFGGWVTIWGALAMLTSAPFDDWWHNAYGLDVKIVSPPHAVLGLGMFAVALGVMLYLLAWQNRATGQEQKLAASCFTLSCGLLVTMISVYATEYTWPNMQHSSNFYQVICCLYPFFFAFAARSCRRRWAATMSAGAYLLVYLLMIWILPLFPAQPKLAPIYNPVDRMAPPAFPLLVILPAIALDLFVRWTDRPADSQARPFWKRGWVLDFPRALGFGLLFLAIILPVQWHFSKYLLTVSSDDWFFGGNRHWPYYSPKNEWIHRFWDLKRGALSVPGALWAALFAILSARLGLWAGNWMLKVRR